jgi:hypothetical protein
MKMHMSDIVIVGRKWKLDHPLAAGPAVDINKNIVNQQAMI